MQLPTRADMCWDLCYDLCRQLCVSMYMFWGEEGFFFGRTMDWRGNAHVHTSIAHNFSLWDAPLPRLVKFGV